MSHILFAAIILAGSALANPIIKINANTIFKQKEQIELVKLLENRDFIKADSILEKFDVNAIGEDNITLLWWQANIGNFEAFEYLLKKGANHMKQSRNSYNILELAAALNDSRFLKAMIKFGANVNMISEIEKATPLLMAVQHGNNENVEILVDAGACVNIADTMGMTPLVWALEMKHYDIALFLIKHGANPKFKSVQGLDAFTSIKVANIETSDERYQGFLEINKVLENCKH